MHVRFLQIVQVAVIVLLAGNTEAFWRMPCQARSGLARIDPLINPGVVGDHAHAIHGGTNFGMSSTYSDLRASSGTSCAVKEDKSAYWHPAVYFMHDDGTTELVPQVGGMLAYYLLYGDNIKAFPAGFQMIAGDTRQRNFTLPVPDPPKSEWSGDAISQPALAQKALGFNCLNYAQDPEPSLFRHFLPDKDYLDAHCTDGVRFELQFPSCWNGKDVDSPDHKSHMAYPNLVMTGDCPKGFETKVPTLFYETIWNTYAFKGKAGQFVIANGDPTGYGYHGDFIGGWDTDFLQQAINTCTNLSGRVEDCPLFVNSGLQSQDEQEKQTITMPDQLKSDDCTGPRTGLPGNNPVQSGPAYATGHGGIAAAAVVAAAANPATPSSKSPGVFVAQVAQQETPSTSPSTSTSTSTSTSSTPPPPPAPTPTPAPSVTPPLPDGPKALTTYYYTTGNVVNEVIVVENIVTVSCTKTISIQVDGGPVPTDDSDVGSYRRHKRSHEAHVHRHHGRHHAR